MLYSCSQQLKLFFGIAAVGTEQGHCYLVDLRLDDEGEEFDEWHASPVELVNPLSHDMPQLRNSARTNGTHLAIEIGSMLPFLFFFIAHFFPSVTRQVFFQADVIPPSSSSTGDNILLDLRNSSDDTQPHSMIANYCTEFLCLLLGFICQTSVFCLCSLACSLIQLNLQ